MNTVRQAAANELWTKFNNQTVSLLIGCTAVLRHHHLIVFLVEIPLHYVFRYPIYSFGSAAVWKSRLSFTLDWTHALLDLRDLFGPQEALVAVWQVFLKYTVPVKVPILALFSANIRSPFAKMLVPSLLLQSVIQVHTCVTYIQQQSRLNPDVEGFNRTDR